MGFGELLSGYRARFILPAKELIVFLSPLYCEKKETKIPKKKEGRKRKKSRRATTVELSFEKLLLAARQTNRSTVSSVVFPLLPR